MGELFNLTNANVKLYDGVTIPEPDNLFDDYKGRGTAARKQDMNIKTIASIKNSIYIP